MADDPRGLAELRDVIARLAGRAQIRDPEASDEEWNNTIAQYAQAVYDRAAPDKDNYDPGLDPQQWQALAMAGEWDGDPYAIPADNVFGYELFTRDANGNRVLNEPALNRLREKIWNGWQGPGWSAGDQEAHVRAYGRGPEEFELSPGDARIHQLYRDHDYLNAVLARGRNRPLDPKQDAFPLYDNAEITPEQWEQYDLDEALKFYNKAALATHSQQPGWLTTPNFQRYSSPPHTSGRLIATLQAMRNPDYSFGWYNQHIGSPLETALNNQAMRADTTTRNQGFVPLVTPVYDYLVNALSGKGGLDSAQAISEGSQGFRHSPTVPLATKDPDRAARIRSIQELRKNLLDAQPMEGGDYHFWRTGQDPSYAGKLGMTLGSGIVGDPTVYGFGMLRGLSGIAGEAVEEAVTGVPIVAGIDYALGPANKNEGPSDRAARLQAEQTKRDAAAQRLSDMNRQAPQPRDYKSAGYGIY